MESDQIKKLIQDNKQEDITNQFVQKFTIIDGDIKMDRNHVENLKFLLVIHAELSKKIAGGILRSEKTAGYEKMRDVVTKLMNDILKKSPESADGLLPGK